jgi:hypothetical protein
LWDIQAQSWRFLKKTYHFEHFPVLNIYCPKQVSNDHFYNKLTLYIFFDLESKGERFHFNSITWQESLARSVALILDKRIGICIVCEILKLNVKGFSRKLTIAEWPKHHMHFPVLNIYFPEQVITISYKLKFYNF